MVTEFLAMRYNFLKIHCIFIVIIVSTMYYYLLRYILVGLFTLFSIKIGISQKSYDDYKKELKSLDGSRFLGKAFEAAEDLAKQKDFSNSLELLDKGVKSARSMGNNTSAVVLYNKAEVIIKYFPRDDHYIKEVIKSVNSLIDKKPPLSLLEKTTTLLNGLKVNISDKMSGELSSILSELDKLQSKVESEQIAQIKIAETKKINSLDKAEIFSELERLKEERIQLESLHTKMAASVSQNESLLKKRTAMINQMSQEQAKKEAIIQYNMRMIDSLKFMAELDSISLYFTDLKISQQESELTLQESQLRLQESELELKSSQQKLYLLLSLLGLIVAGFLGVMMLISRRTNKNLALKNEQIEKEKERSESLLLNILPKYIAQELKDNSKVKTRMIKESTVIFTDFINFSSITKQISPQELIATLDECFRAFDEIISRHNIEKIKTIGDAYMCAGGVPVSNETHAIDAVNAASEMVEFLNEWNAKREKENKIRFDARIGIHSGPIIAGVVGAKKFAYDIWGDTVNIASRLESQSSAQMINISETTYQLIKEHYECTKRGSIGVKNMSDLEMYYVKERQSKAILN